MSHMPVSTVVARAVIESDFRDRLSEQPDEVLSAFQLTPPQIEVLKRIDKSAFEAVAENLTKFENCSYCLIC